MKIGNLVKEARESLGWDQAELARRVGIGQQTVSRWERGHSRPSKDMVWALASVFQGNLDQWLSASGHSSPLGLPKSSKSSNPQLPVVSLLPHLPLQNLTPENFELFHVSLLKALYPSAEVTREGKSGHKQYGVDISVRFEDGSLFIFQCKRVTAFGKAKVKEAIAATEIAATQYFLCLSRIASPDARKEIRNHEGWHLWDCENISFKVRDLDIDLAGRLIDTYFGGPVRAAFLGLANPGPWITSEEYYRPFEDTERTFTHGWPFIGHANEIESLLDAILEDASPVIALSSPGGTGKTRLIKEVAKRLTEENPELSIRFASQGIEITPADFDAVPLGKTLLIIDDVHDREDFRALLALITHFRKDVSVLLTTRPYHEQKIRLDAGAYGFEPTILRTVALTLDEHIQLSREILKSQGGDESLAKRIAEVTKDSPLATSIGSSLVAKRAIEPLFLTNEGEFQRVILLHFQDALLGAIAGSQRDEGLRELVRLVALLQPISLQHPEHQKTFEIVLSKPWDAIHRQLLELRDAGILVQRGTLVRITPDLLADLIVADNCVDSISGAATGFADRVFNQASDEMVSNLLINLAKLDWRLSAGPVPAKFLLSNIWQAIENRFADGDDRTRTQYMLMAGAVGYFQPNQILRLAKMAIMYRAKSPIDHDKEATFGYSSPELFKRALAIMLQNAAYGAASDVLLLNEICDQLWELGRDDARILNQTPEHPIRILSELASITPGKPLEFNQMILSNALNWLPRSLDDDAYSVFDVVRSVLATDGFETKSSNKEIKFLPYMIVPSVVAPLRSQVVEAALKELSSSSLVRAIRAAELLEDSIRGPVGMFDRVITEEDREVWNPQIQDVLTRILKVVQSTKLDPFVQVRILQSVKWYLKYSKNMGLQNIAKDIFLSINRTPNFLVSQAFASHWEMEDLHATDSNSSKSNPLRTLANDLDSQLQDNELIQILLERLSVLQTVPSLRRADPGFLIGQIVEANPAVGTNLVEHALINPAGPASMILSPALAALARSNANLALSLARRALQLDLPHFNLQVSFAYGWGLDRGRVATEDELSLIETLSKSPDTRVRINVLGCIRQVAQQDSNRALEVILGCGIGDSEKLAAEALSNFGRQGVFRTEEISPWKLQDLLDQLSELPSIEEYEIGRALQSIGRIYPDMVMMFLLNRIKRNAFEDPITYRAIPFMWESANLIDLRGAPNHQDYLRSIRDLTLDPDLPSDNWSMERDIVDLFALIAVDYSDPVIEILQEWVTSGDAKRLTKVARLLQKAPHDLILEKQTFVDLLLTNAYSFGMETFKIVCSSLLSLATMGSKSGQVGQPYPRDLQQRTVAIDMLSKLTSGSPMSIFYEGLLQTANRNILRSVESDEMDVDE